MNFTNFYNSYLFTLDAAQSATAAEIDREVRHQVRLFEIDAICLQSQVEQSQQYVLEMLRTREDQNPAPQIVSNGAGQINKNIPPLKVQQAMAPYRQFPTAQSDQEMSAAVASNISPAAAQDNGFLQNVMAAMSGANAAPRAAPNAPNLQVGTANPTTAPNTII